MKIIGVAVKALDDGNEITVTFKLDQREEYEESDITAVLDTVRECRGRAGTGSAGRVDVGEPEVSRDTKPAPATGRQRRGSAAAEPVADKEIAQAEAFQHRVGDPAPEGRRRRGAENPTSSAPVAPSPATAEPGESVLTGRQRRGIASAETPKASEADETPVSNAAAQSPSEGGGRQRRSVPTQNSAPAANTRSTATTTGAATGPSSKKISDEDLLKAASETTRKCGNDAEVVKGIMRKFAVGQLGKLAPEDRPAFLEACAKARAAA